MKNKLINTKVEKILKLISSADGGCEYCCSKIFGHFIEMFPEHKNDSKEFFKKKFKISLNKFNNERR